MGGRLVTELAAADPDRAVAVILIDAIVGDAWDQIVTACRWWPPLLSVFSTAAVCRQPGHHLLRRHRPDDQARPAVGEDRLGRLSRGRGNC